nr:hypothetical protein L203_02491 [Cryptococcus depauperatus CBS 7841]
MPPTTYAMPPKPASLHALLETGNSQNGAPTLDLRWEPFQKHIEGFLNAIDAYTQAARTEIIARASDHMANIRELKADQEEMERRIQAEREREGEMLANLEQERHTIADLDASLSHLRASLDKTKEQSTNLEAELQAVKREVTLERTEKERQRNVLNQMRDRDTFELQQLEEALGWRVEGINQDQLLMRFTLVDPEEPAREFSIILDVSKHDYRIPSCDPPIPSLPELLRQLNSDRDISAFVKKGKYNLRRGFRALIPNPPNPSTKFDDLSGPGPGLRTPRRNNRASSSATPAMLKSITEGSAVKQLSLNR